ncbi:MAG: ABC transporter ATP-binding protein [Cyanobacteria bacterium J06633_2]
MVDSVDLHSAIATPSQTTILQLSNITKVFEQDAALQGINLVIHQGEFFSILGPSGSGKTTLLRLIAGFEKPTAGNITIGGQEMTDVPAYRRPVNTVFQSYALFSHMTVWDNVAFGPKIQKLPKLDLRQRVKEALQLVKMESFASRYPAQLSGGQQQRVALARALVSRPAILLLDEPLAALDLKLRKEMQVELATLHQDLGITFILVTHDQEEALSLSSRIAVMREGRIEQVDPPQTLYDSPQTPFVADFIGDTNLFYGTLVKSESDGMEVQTSRGLHLLITATRECQRLSHYYPLVREGDRPAQDVVVSVRPENICLSSTPPNQVANCFEGTLHTVMYMGMHVQCVVVLSSGDRLKVLQPSSSNSSLTLRSTVYVYWNHRDSLALMADY